jgi:hypothetical protein
MTAKADTQATTAHVRNNLINLDSYMAQLPGSDVKAFHTYLRHQYQTLTARGETTHDLVHHLFKGYDSTKCDEFVKYIKRKKDDFLDGTLDFTPDSLMLVAENKLSDLTVTKEWTALSAQEQIVLALRAQIAEKINKRNPKKPGAPRIEEVGPKLAPAKRFTGMVCISSASSSSLSLITSLGHFFFFCWFVYHQRRRRHCL